MTLRCVLLTGCVLVALAGLAPAADKPEDAAQAAAEAWLRLVDSGDYSGSWTQAAKRFRGGIKQADWAETIEDARAPLGRVLSRKLKSRQYTEKLPGLPAGKYVLIEYETTFEHQASAVEAVTPMADPDGVWRVAGYYVR